MKRPLSFLLWLTTVFIGPFISGQTSLERDFYNGTSIRVDFLKENLLRIRISPNGSELKESGLNTYGFIQDIANDGLKVKTEKSRNGFTAGTTLINVRGNSTTGELLVTDRSGKKTYVHQISAEIQGSGASKVTFLANKEEDWIGFGDQSRERLYHRGFKADCYVLNVTSYIPVPFFMSTNGSGILVNTSSRTVFDMCRTDPDKYSWTDESGRIDYYVMTGNGFREMIGTYTDLTGKPKIPPVWAFGLWYICRTQANDYEAVNDALNFRREGIPCDVIGLEPGWMEKNYDYSTKKTWSKERFPIPSYAQNGPHNFIDAIKRMGFKMELWLCNDYDLSYEEERRLKDGPPEFIQGASAKNVKEIVEVDGHLVRVDEKIRQGDRVDQITIKEEPWFRHLEKFVDQGADFFKQDGSNQVIEHKGKTWGNGMKDAEMHNLYPLFYSRQMYEGFLAHTGRRPVIFTPAGWTGFQAWSGTWTGDTGGRLATLGAMLNTSIVGHAWSTNDMEVMEKEGIHFGYLQPWSQINSWNYFRMPWIQGAELSDMHKFYSQFRSRLIPYLYSWAYNSSKTGWPMLVPLTLEFPEDKNCRNNLHQYLLGHDLMVGIYEKKMWFPEGSWKDCWTGEIIDGTQEKEVSWPADRGGALYMREGAIIPFGPLMQYRGEKPLDEITLYIFPGKEPSSFNLYEDDGVSMDHLRGDFSITPVSVKKEDGQSVIDIGNSEGTFSGKVTDRLWNIVMHSEVKPSLVSINGVRIQAGDYLWDENRKEVTVNGITAPSTISLK